jgi:predicted 3-demethylubiquinone-9 3-methyltransferase (glyoxalase superfamily)
MADDRTKKDYRDKTRINLNEKYEVSYWKDKFGVSGQALAGAVRAVGSSSVKKVEEYLKKKKG